MNENQQIVESVKKHFGGRLPLEEAQQIMNLMSKDDLQKLVLVACNRLGTQLKGGEYQGELDTHIHLGTAIDIIFGAFSNASIDNMSNTNEVGNS